MKKAFALFVAAGVAAVASADIQGLNAIMTGHAPIGQAFTFAPDENINRYANVTTFTGSAFASGGAQNQAGNTITTLLADDINRTGAAGQALTDFTFSVANLNTGNVSARPRVRFYAADGVGGGPGTLIGGYTFNPISFVPGVSTFFTGLLVGGPVMPTSFWAGITFDNNTGATGATAAQLNNLGQGLFDPPTLGTSADRHWISAAAGSNFVSNPAGSIGNSPFAANPVANYGWSFNTVPTPGALAVLGLGGLVAGRRRR